MKVREATRVVTEITADMLIEHGVKISAHPREAWGDGEYEFVFSVAPVEGRHLDHKPVGYLEPHNERFVVTHRETAKERCSELGALLEEHGIT